MVSVEPTRLPELTPFAVTLPLTCLLFPVFSLSNCWFRFLVSFMPLRMSSPSVSKTLLFIDFLATLPRDVKIIIGGRPLSSDEIRSICGDLIVFELISLSKPWVVLFLDCILVDGYVRSMSRPL